MKTINNLKAEEIRKSILQLAIQGKLVKQDPNDEPASELVKRIYAEKQKLIKEGKIKKDKNESYIFKGDDNCYYEKIGNNEPVKLEDLPFDIPDNWTWIRQKNICRLDNGIKSKGEKLPYLEAKVIRGKIEPTFLYEGIIVDNSYKVILVDGENSGEIMTPPMRGYMGSTFKIFSATSLFNSNLLLYVFLLHKDKYKNSKVGAAIPHLNKDLFKESYIAVPPLNEQERIVNKINSFEPLIADYAKAEEKLTKLEGEFPEKLKKSILQYAIEGKLVKQDPNDEPASVLLERIKAEKERLIREGKIKRDKNESYIYQGDDKNYYEKKKGETVKLDDEFILSLPENIEKQRFRTVLDVRDGTHESPSYYLDGYPFISSKNLNNGRIDYKNIKFISKENFEKYNIRSNAEENDILFGMIGTIGNPAIIDNPPYKFAFKNMALIKANRSLFNPRYVLYYLIWIEKKFKAEASGGIQQFISLDYIRNSIITIPSIKYQNKVVDLLDNILTL